MKTFVSATAVALMLAAPAVAHENKQQSQTDKMLRYDYKHCDVQNNDKKQFEWMMWYELKQLQMELEQLKKILKSHDMGPPYPKN